MSLASFRSPSLRILDVTLSSFRKPSLRIVDFTNTVRQELLRQQICHSYRRHQIANMSAAGDNSGPEKKVEIVWDDNQNLFRTPDGKAYLSYTVRAPRSKNSAEKTPDVLDLQHTFVPGSFRGQGVAARLCVAAFEHAKEKGFLVQPTCSYISDTFLPRHPEWNDLVVKNGAQSGL
ncbi:unnamed protein product [Calypogeia fissa]